MNCQLKQQKMKNQMLHDLTCVFEGFDNKGTIYISGITTAKNIAVLQRYNIKSVLCAARSGFTDHDKNIITDYLYIPADDYEQFDLLQYFQKAYHFIEQSRKKTNVLVHCMAGISRSATLVIAYLIKKYGYSVESVLTLMKRKRSIINPNQGFLEQLKTFQNIHFSSEDKGDSKKTIIRHSDYLLTNFEKKPNNLSRQLHRPSIQNNQSRSIQSSHRRRASLSRQSIQFLKNIKNEKQKTLRKQNIELENNKLNKLNTSPDYKNKPVLNGKIRRRFSNVEQIISKLKDKHSQIKLNKPEFYSSELGSKFTLNMIQVQQQVNQLQLQSLTKVQQQQSQQIEQKLPNNSIKVDTQQNLSVQQVVSYVSVSTQPSNTSTYIIPQLQAIKNVNKTQQIIVPSTSLGLSLKQKLQIMKLNLLKQYKSNRVCSNQQNQQSDSQKNIDINMAKNILKGLKPKRYANNVERRL